MDEDLTLIPHLTLITSLKTLFPNKVTFTDPRSWVFTISLGEVNPLVLPKWLSNKESACQCRRCKRHRFDPWVGKIPWRKKWKPTLVLLPGKFHGQRSLVGYSPWGHKEADMTERLSVRVCVCACACTHTHTYIQPIMPRKKKSKRPENSLKVQRKRKRKKEKDKLCPF